MGDWIIRFEGQGLANQIHGQRVAAGLLGDDAEVVQRPGMVGVSAKDLAVERFRFRQTPSLVALDRDLKRLWNGHGLFGARTGLGAGVRRSGHAEVSASAATFPIEIPTNR